MQIPDDLSPPSENEALRLPPDAGPVVPRPPGECLESPPSFFGDARPFRRTAEPEARETEERQPEVEQPAPPPAGGDDRVIDN